MISTEIDPSEFRRVLSYYPTGVCAITALSADGRPAGLVVGTFTSVSLDPPLVGFFPDKKSTSWPLIEGAGHFCVNVLSDGQQDVCRTIAAKGSDKFADVDFSLSADDLPIIAQALACIECRLHSVTEAGDHWFVLGRVFRLATKSDNAPMVFHRGRYGSFAENPP